MQIPQRVAKGAARQRGEQVVTLINTSQHELAEDVGPFAERARRAGVHAARPTQVHAWDDKCTPTKLAAMQRAPWTARDRGSSLRVRVSRCSYRNQYELLSI